MKIELKLLAAFTTIIALLVAGSLLSIEMSKRSLRTAIGEDHALQAEQLLSNIDREIYYRLETIISYGRDVLLRDTVNRSNQVLAEMTPAERRAWLKRRQQAWRAAPAESTSPLIDDVLQSPLAEELREKKEFYQHDWLRQPLYPELLVTNSYGALVAATKRTDDYLLTDTAWYQKAMPGQDFWLGNMVYDEQRRIYICDIVVKIYDEDQQVAGLFKAVLNLETIEPLLHEVVEQHADPKGGRHCDQLHVTLLTSDHRVIYACRPDYNSNDDLSSHALLRDMKPEIRAAFFTAEADTKMDQKNLVAYANSSGYQSYKGLGWLLIMEVDTKTSFAPISTFARRMWFFAGFMTVVALLLTWFFSRFFAGTVQQLAATTTNLKQRINELHCLYGISKLVEKNKDDIDKIAQGTADLIPAAWHYPEITCARIKINGSTYQSTPFAETAWLLSREITSSETRLGSVEVYLLEEKPSLDEGPFLKEERELLNAIAERLGHLIKWHRARQEKEQMRAFVFQQEKLASVGQLAAGVAHEINNPVGFISSNLSTLHKYIGKITTYLAAADSGQSSEELRQLRKKLKIDFIFTDIRDLINESLEGTERVREIVQNLKSFSRAEEQTFVRADINECLEKTLKVIWNELKYKATIIKEYGRLPSVKCYPQQLNQVFMNLLINAVQAIDTKGEITIQTWQEDKEIHVAISDTGQGIAPQNLSQLFEPFYTTKEAGKGTGLGLSIAHDIIRQHKGRIDVISRPGKGSTFTVIIPDAE